MTAGQYRAIELDLQGTNPEQAAHLQQRLEQTKAALEAENTGELTQLTKHDLVGDLLYATIFSYFALNNLQDDIAAQTANMVNYRLPSYGTFSTNVQTQYWFGVPRDVSFAGLSMDMDRMANQGVSKTGNREEAVAFQQAAGARMSAMEHLVPEQMFSSEGSQANGISAVKAIAIASAEGQKIWTIDRDNVNLALSEINLNTDTERDIRNAVNAGKIVTTHEARINFHGWIGEGYIILDPNTGAGAYMIAGGGNGGETILSGTADALVYLSNADDASRSLRFLSGFASTWFGFANNSFAVLQVDGCSEFDAVAGALLAGLIGGWLTKISFALAAAILNPLLLLVVIILITQLINFVQRMVVDAVISSCRNSG